MQGHTFDTEMFNDLPLELQRQIINEQPKLLLSFSGANKDYNELLERPIYNLCDQEVNRNEMNKIMDYQPIHGGLHKKYLKYTNHNITQVGNLMVIFQKHPMLGNHTIMIEVVLNAHELKIQEIPTSLHDEKLAFYQTNNHDLLTFYNIWSNRLNCMKMDQAYAKNRIINQFNNQRQLYENFIRKDKKVDFNYKNIITTVYCSLIVNKYVFNIMDPSNITKLKDMNIEEIKKDIDYLHHTIYQKLLDL